MNKIFAQHDATVSVEDNTSLIIFKLKESQATKVQKKINIINLINPFYWLYNLLEFIYFLYSDFIYSFVSEKIRLKVLEAPAKNVMNDFVESSNGKCFYLRDIHNLSEIDDDGLRKLIQIGRYENGYESLNWEEKSYYKIWYVKRIANSFDNILEELNTVDTDYSQIYICIEDTLLVQSHLTYDEICDIIYEYDEFDEFVIFVGVTKNENGEIAHQAQLDTFFGI